MLERDDPLEEVEELSGVVEGAPTPGRRLEEGWLEVYEPLEPPPTRPLCLCLAPPDVLLPVPLEEEDSFSSALSRPSPGLRLLDSVCFW